MALFKRKSVWWLDITSPDGRRVRETTGTQDKKLAQQYHDKRKTDMWTEHRLGIKPDVPFAEAADLFLREKGHRRSVESYEAQMKWWKEQYSGKVLREVTQESIIKIIENKRSEGVSNATCNRYLAALRGVLRLVHAKYRMIDSVPKVFLYPEPKGRVRWLAPDEVARLLAALPAYLRGPARLALATGLRQSNVLGLRWDQVDFNRQTLTISGAEMKNGRDFTVPLSSEAMAAIREGVGLHDTYVFVTPTGRRIAGVPSRAWASALKQAGIKDLRWHDLRHTWATMMTQAGVPTDVIQELGSWESPQMVKRYAHHSAESLRQHIWAADKPLSEAMARLRHTPDEKRLFRVA